MGLKSGLYGRRKRKPAYKNTEIELTADQKVSQFFEKTRNKLIDSRIIALTLHSQEFPVRSIPSALGFVRLKNCRKNPDLILHGSERYVKL